AAFLDDQGRARWRATVERQLISGPVPAYAVTLEREGAGGAPGIGINRALVHVSREGGHVLWFLGEARQAGSVGPGGQAAGDTDQGASDPMSRLRRRALEFLRDRGLEAFVATGWIREGERVTFSLVRESDGIRYYPELVKVTLDESERIVGYDAVAYWLNRDPQRRLPEPVLSPDDARGLAGPLLEVTGVRPAVIPLPSGRQVLTYEVLGSLGEDRFLLYYNAQTGREEMILRLVETDRARISF
ncbi:MAG TPA: PepSY1/2 domain-containing protein, partial [Bacillota bacterium]